MIEELLSSEPALAPDELARAAETVVVCTFYKAQARQLQARLASVRPDVSIMTVDAAQVRESFVMPAYVDDVATCFRCSL